MHKALTVAELRKNLAELPDEWIVVLPSDEEGNSHRVLSADGICINALFSEDQERANIRFLTEELINAGFTEDDILTDGQPCVILF